MKHVRADHYRAEQTTIARTQDSPASSPSGKARVCKTTSAFHATPTLESRSSERTHTFAPGTEHFATVQTLAARLPISRLTSEEARAYLTRSHIREGAPR